MHGRILKVKNTLTEVSQFYQYTIAPSCKCNRFQIKIIYFLSKEANHKFLKMPMHLAPKSYISPAVTFDWTCMGSRTGI